MAILLKDFYRDKRVFVTGHTGFKGSWLCKMLTNAGAKVTGFSLSPNTSPTLFGMASFRKRSMGHMARACYGVFPSSIGDMTSTEWAMGFFFVVRKSLMEKWHLRFDENLKSYAYAEDLDFTYGYYLKANAEKLRCIMSRKLVVRHNASREYRIPLRKHTFMLVFTSLLYQPQISNAFV